MSLSPAPTRHDVLTVAEELFTTEGPAALSVRRIADRLGVSRQIVYSRYDGKADLVRALHARGFERLGAGFAAVEEPPGTREHLVAMAQAYRRTARAQPALFELMFGRPVMEFEPDEQARELAARSFQPVVDAAAAWLSQGGSAPAGSTPLGLARALWAATHGVVSLELAGLLGRDAGPLLERLVIAAVSPAPVDGSLPGTS